MTRLPVALAGVAILVAGSACAGRSQPDGPVGVNREVILPEEFDRRNFYSAYDAVSALRPGWLSRRGGNGEIQVYVDDNHVGGLEVLRQVRIASVQLIRHIDGITAGARYGRGHDQGVILLTTIAGR
jgi:hypothetical protein